MRGKKCLDGKEELNKARRFSWAHTELCERSICGDDQSQPAVMDAADHNPFCQSAFICPLHHHKINLFFFFLLSLINFMLLPSHLFVSRPPPACANIRMFFPDSRSLAAIVCHVRRVPLSTAQFHQCNHRAGQHHNHKRQSRAFSSANP